MIVPANIIGQWEIVCPELRDGTPITMYLEQVYQHMVGAVLLDDARKHLRKTKLMGNKLQFELDIQRDRDVLSVVFKGEVLGDVMAGEVTWDRGSRIEKYPWRAVRDPRTELPRPAAARQPHPSVLVPARHD